MFRGLASSPDFSDGNDGSIFLSWKFPIPRYFWEGKFGKYFLGWIDFSGHVFGHSKQPEDSW